MDTLGILYDQTGSGKSKMAARRSGNIHISVCRPDSNEISMANLQFSRSRNLIETVRILYNYTGSGKSKMAAEPKRKYS